MKSIGIDDSTHDIYESSNGVWYLVWPATPVFSRAAFVDSDKDSPASEHDTFERDLSTAKIIYREDSFDPITRIRRGRFYKPSDDSRPAHKLVLPHPIYGIRGLACRVSDDGRVERLLHVFDQYPGRPQTNAVIIGSDESRWRVLGAERIISGEYLVTLKARHTLGVLPELNPEAIPEMRRARAVETFETLVDSAYREIPVNIVDRARDVAAWFFGTWAATQYGENSLILEELGKLIEKIDQRKDKPQVILSTARIVARLHSRGKANEQEKRSTRPLMEADAEFALAAVGLLLREFGWTR